MTVFFVEFGSKFNFKNKALSSIKEKEVLNKLGFKKFLYMRDSNFSPIDRMVLLHNTEATHWVLYIIEISFCFLWMPTCKINTKL